MEYIEFHQLLNPIIEREVKAIAQSRKSIEEALEQIQAEGEEVLVRM